MKIAIVVLAVYAAYNWLKLHTVKQAVAAVDIDMDKVDVSQAREIEIENVDPGMIEVANIINTGLEY